MNNQVERIVFSNKERILTREALCNGIENQAKTIAQLQLDNAVLKSELVGCNLNYVDVCVENLELKADKAKLREALGFIANRSNTMYECEVCASEALGETK